MEISLDKLIAEINQSQKYIVSIYLFGEMGIGASRFIEDKPYINKDENGNVFFSINGAEETGYYINDHHEIYQEETDEGARAKFEVREQGILLMEIRLY